MRWRCVWSLLICLAIWGVIVRPAAALRGQTIVVPVYSHVYHGDKERPFLLAATVALRNADLRQSITITAVDYHDSQGRLVRSLAPEPILLGPLASVRFVIPESDASGGSGASCVVRWQADADVAAPVAEAVMIGTRSSQGISFVTSGRVIEEIQ
jgi:hypothetical protein